MKKLLSLKNSFMKKMMMAVALVVGTVSAWAEGETPVNQVSTLWDKLGIEFDAFFEQVFEALKLPVGTILAVVFVMAIFYFCVKMAKSAINKRNSI